MKVPSKFYWLTTPIAGVPVPLASAQLVNPNIAGFRWRQDHSTIQTAEATYDWSALDAALAACVTNGKLLGLSIDCGLGIAPWVYDTVETFNFDPANPLEGEMPNIFDPLYLPIIEGFIETMGGIYNAHPNVSYVVATGFGQQYESTIAVTDDEETRFNINAQGAGFDDIGDGWTQISQAIISAFVTAFPDTAILFTSAQPYPSDAGTVEDALRDWSHDTYPQRAGWMTDDLHAVSGPWTVGSDLDWPHGYQAPAPGSDLEGIYGTAPIPDPVPPQIMIDYLNSTLAESAQFVELYPYDLNLAANQTTFATYAPSFHSFLEYTSPGGGGVPVPIVPPEIEGLPPVTTTATSEVRIVPCKTGTHARNIILGRRRHGIPAAVPVAPGAVALLDVTTPHTPSSGLATATWFAPLGSVAADLNYRVFLTGGSGTIEIVSQVLNDVTGRTLVTASISFLAPGQFLTLNVSAINTVSNLEGPVALFSFISDAAGPSPLVRAAPVGVYALVNATEGIISGDISTRAWLGYAYVDGGTLPTTWKALNSTSSNSFNWSQTDAFLAACDDNSKLGGISVSMGIKTPTWLYTSGGASDFFVNGPNSGKIPLPWDSRYLQAVKAFIHQFATRYDGNTSLSYVTVGGMGQLLETLLVQAADYANLNELAVAAGYPDLLTAWAETSAGILDYWSKAMPRTTVYLALELPVPSTDDGLTGIDDFVQAAITTYGERLGLMTLQLDGVTAADTNLSLNSIIRDAVTTPRAFRFLRPSSDPACDPSQDPDTYDAEDGLQSAATAGIALLAQMEEFYEADVLTLTDNYPTHLAAAQTSLTNNAV